MPIPSYLAVLLEAGAVTHDGKNADPRMIRYETSIYPVDAGVELLVWDIENFRLAARLAEPRLAVWLEELAINMDLALSTKASEGGKMIGRLQMEQQVSISKSMMDKRNDADLGLDSMNYNKEAGQDPGNKKY